MAEEGPNPFDLRASSLIANKRTPAGREAHIEQVMNLSQVVGLDSARLIGEAVSARMDEILMLFGDDVIPPSLLAALVGGMHEWADTKFCVRELAATHAAREHGDREGINFVRPMLGLQSFEQAYDAEHHILHARRRYVAR